MRRIIPFAMFVFAFSACAHSAGTMTAANPSNPDPACPNGYTWAVQPDDADHGACLWVGITLTKDCQSYREVELDPPYAFWACGNALMTLAPNPWQ